MIDRYGDYDRRPTMGKIDILLGDLRTRIPQRPLSLSLISLDGYRISPTRICTMSDRDAWKSSRIAALPIALEKHALRQISIMPSVGMLCRLSAEQREAAKGRVKALKPKI